MPSFALDPEQRRWCARLRALARDRLRPLADAGTPGRINRPLTAALGELGLLERLLPEEGPVRALDLCLLRESLAMECTEAETALALQGLGAYPIVLSGGEKLYERWMPGIRAGRTVTAFALSEPDAGSDAAALTLRADRDGTGGWRLTGEKCWISNAPEADVTTVFARTPPGAGSRGVTAFLVPADRPGLGGEPLEMLSPHPIGRLVFDGVLVTAED